mmetsp:Transcript_129176/g.288736  ORF Transcript_129176/g.288736 Transcript_129176/m.288736 type:complete len:267 (-) Transcript_129176:1061-1861(-)
MYMSNQRQPRSLPKSDARGNREHVNKFDPYARDGDPESLIPRTTGSHGDSFVPRSRPRLRLLLSVRWPPASPEPLRTSRRNRDLSWRPPGGAPWPRTAATAELAELDAAATTEPDAWGTEWAADHAWRAHSSRSFLRSCARTKARMRATFATVGRLYCMLMSSCLTLACMKGQARTVLNSRRNSQFSTACILPGLRKMRLFDRHFFKPLFFFRKCSASEAPSSLHQLRMGLPPDPSANMAKHSMPSCRWGALRQFFVTVQHVKFTS